MIEEDIYVDFWPQLSLLFLRAHVHTPTPTPTPQGMWYWGPEK